MWRPHGKIAATLGSISPTRPSNDIMQLQERLAVAKDRLKMCSQLMSSPYQRKSLSPGVPSIR